MTKGRRALRAGLTAAFAFVLTSALFSAPLLAAQHDFGHSHPVGTPHHVHTLHAVLGGGVVGAPVLEAPFSLEAKRAPRLSRALPLQVLHHTSHDSRAPPTS